MTARAHELGDWSWERIEKLKRLWAEGWTASGIASRFGDVTRSAVLGKVHRLGLSSRVASVHPKRPKRKHIAVIGGAIAKVKDARKRRKRHNDGDIRPPILPESIQPRTFDDIKEPISLNVPLIELTSDSCRWPNAEFESSFLFCGHVAKVGSVYCPYHSRVCYQPPQPRRDRALERSARSV